MVKGPLEQARDRLWLLEERAGLRPVSREKGPRQRGELGPGGRWLLARLKDGHPERLTRVEEDILGNALQADLDGRMAEAQALLDVLSEHHRLRLSLEASGTKEA